jgi:two-component system OmpR family response regulator
LESKDVQRTKALAQLGVKGTRANPARRPSRSVSEKDEYVASVLCVDDEPSAREFASEVLNSNGYLVRTAGSVDEAIAILEACPSIDLTLLDLRMPGRDGFELLNFIDKNLRFKRVAAVVISSCGQVDMVRKAIEHGACGYLVKPITKELLLQRVAEALDVTRAAVMIISSDKVASRILEQILVRDKCSVIHAPSARDALRLSAEKRMDIVICDLGLVDSTGPECLLGIREIGCFAPVFFLDDPDSKIAEQDAIAVGAHGLIKRPFTGLDITNQIRGALHTHRSKRSEAANSTEHS